MTKMILKRQLQKNKKKGFTLIELIVVIVIIAIIAAIAVPALTRYIGSAEQRQVQALAHNVQLVLQAERSDYYFLAFNSFKDTDISSTTIAYTKPGDPNDIEVGYYDILNGSGISLRANDVLSDVQWGGTGATGTVYEPTTLFQFTISNGNWSVTYNVETGFQQPVAE